MNEKVNKLPIETLESKFVAGADSLPKLKGIEKKFALFSDLSLIVKEVRKRWIKLGKSPDVPAYRKASAVYYRMCSYLFTLHQHLGIRERVDAKKLLGGGPSYYVVRVISFSPTGVTAVVKNGAGQKQEVDICDLRPMMEVIQ